MGQVVSQAELEVRRGGWKRGGQVVVCALGRFDLLHPGHVRFLEQARALGNILVVGVISVASAAIDRPVTPAAERAEILAALTCVDFAVELDGSAGQFLEKLAPDVLAEGSVHEIPGAASASRPPVAAPPYRVVRIPLEPGFSSAALIERIRKVHS